jgi:hypothetical protein
MPAHVRQGSALPCKFPCLADRAGVAAAAAGAAGGQPAFGGFGATGYNSAPNVTPLNMGQGQGGAQAAGAGGQPLQQQQQQQLQGGGGSSYDRDWSVRETASTGGGALPTVQPSASGLSMSSPRRHTNSMHRALLTR